MKNSIKDNSEEAQFMRSLAKMVKAWPEPEQAGIFDSRYIERLRSELDFKPHGMGQDAKSGTWCVKVYIGGRQWAAGYFHRELQWWAALVADVVNLTLWPYRASYDGTPTPPRDTFNHRYDEVYGATLGESPFAVAVRKWANQLKEGIVRYGWITSLGPDGVTPVVRRRTVTDSFNKFQWEQADFNSEVSKFMERVNAHAQRVNNHNEAVGKDLANLFAQQNALHEKLDKALGGCVVRAEGDDARNLFAMHHGLDIKLTGLAEDVRQNTLEARTAQAATMSAIHTVHQERNDFLDAHRDLKETLDTIAQGIAVLLRRSGEAALRPTCDLVFKHPTTEPQCVTSQPNPDYVTPTDDARVNECLGLDKQPIRYEEAPEHPICPGCKNEIDPDVCHCGENCEDHHEGFGHNPVPMGCTCGYATAPTPAPFVAPPPSGLVSRAQPFTEDEERAEFITDCREGDNK